MTKLVATAVALAALFGAAASADARTHPITRVVERISYADLDLSTARGAHTMLHRIQAAASRACAQPRSDLLPRAQSEASRCRSDAIGRAVSTLGSPQVTAAYGGSPSPRLMKAER